MRASDFEINNYTKLDTILTKLCELVDRGQQSEKDYGMVAAAVLDPNNKIIARLNRPSKDGTRIHAERAAIDSYQKAHGPIPRGSIIVTTLNPCSDIHMDERYGENCTELVNKSGIKKVYCGYLDPTQNTGSRDFSLLETSNKQLRNRCKEFADTFLDSVNEGKKRQRKVRRSAYGPGPFGGYGYYSGYSGDGSDGGDGGMEESITPKTIHKLANRKGIKWDNEPSFLKLTKQLTGKEHLDDLNQAELRKVKQYLNKQVVAENFADSEVGEDRHPNAKPYGPETKPTMPKGTVRVDVSDVYDWYKLGKDISNLKLAKPSNYGKGPPSTIMAFGSEEEEHKYIDSLKKLGLTTTDIDPVDPNQPKGMPRQKTDPTYNVGENFADGKNPQDKGDSKRHGVNTKASVSSLRNTAKQGGRKGQLAHWMANMKAGKAKKK